MSEIIKVAFVGTSCIGKTALLERCREEFSDGIFVEEAARAWFEAHPEVTDDDERFGVKIQKEVQALALFNERAAHRQAEAALKLGMHSVKTFCDRSGLDAPVYVAAQNNEEGATELLHIVKPWLPTYNNIFLLDPSDVPYATDSIRREPESTRQHIHDTYKDFCERHGIPYTPLSGTLDERVAKVKEYIKAA